MKFKSSLYAQRSNFYRIAIFTYYIGVLSHHIVRALKLSVHIILQVILQNLKRFDHIVTFSANHSLKTLDRWHCVKPTKGPIEFLWILESISTIYVIHATTWLTTVWSSGNIELPDDTCGHGVPWTKHASQENPLGNYSKDAQVPEVKILSVLLCVHTICCLSELSGDSTLLSAEVYQLTLRCTNTDLDIPLVRCLVGVQLIRSSLIFNLDVV